MSNYSETIMYKIVCKDENITDCYVGHTIDFRQRKRQHKESCNNEKSIHYNNKLYQTIRSNGGLDNWNMIEIEKFPCENIFQAKSQEAYWIETLGASLNSRIPNRTQKEWYQDNKDIVLEKCKDYRNEHKEHLAETTKLWVEENKEYVADYKHQWYEMNKDRILEEYQEYYKEHKEEILEKHRQYHQDHKEEIHSKKAIYYENHKEQEKERSAKHYEANRLEKIAYQKAYALANKEKIKEYKRLHNLKKKLEKQQQEGK
jgi:hypothetical protein